LDCKKKNIVRFLLLLCALICLFSCATKTAAGDSRPFVWLANNAQFFLLPPEGIENPMDMPQLVSASYGGKDYALNTWVQADESGMSMTLVNELGANMGELSYRGGAVSFSSSVFPQSLGGEYIVADFQLCFYNAPALRQALKDCGLSFEDAETVRRVLQRKNVIIEIDKGPNIVRLVNHLRGYVYTLEGEFE